MIKDEIYDKCMEIAKKHGSFTGVFILNDFQEFVDKKLTDEDVPTELTDELNLSSLKIEEILELSKMESSKKVAEAMGIPLIDIVNSPNIDSFIDDWKTSMVNEEQEKLVKNLSEIINVKDEFDKRDVTIEFIAYIHLIQQTNALS